MPRGELRTVEPSGEVIEDLLPVSERRPVLEVGSPVKGEDGGVLSDDWVPYTIAVPTMAGHWKPDPYGVYAWLGSNPLWEGDTYYLVPNEWSIPPEDKLPETQTLAQAVWQAAIGSSRPALPSQDALERAREAGRVEDRFAWGEDPMAPLRVVARNVWAYMQKEGFKRDVVKARIEDVAQEPLDGAKVLHGDLLRQARLKRAKEGEGPDD